MLIMMLSASLLAHDVSTETEQAGPRFGPPPTRAHTTIQSDGVGRLYAANQTPITQSYFAMSITGETRLIATNTISEHDTGRFPNAGNPHSIRAQSNRYVLPLEPKLALEATWFTLGEIGVGVNGVVFDPTAAEWYQGNRRSGWQYEALSGAVSLGLDEHFAHVQPNGKYHYHGLPTGLLAGLEVSPQGASPIIGWAFDGFPIYALNAEASDGSVVEMQSSYRLKSGKRPDGRNDPGGHYDGTFTADYEYVEGLGDLNACNAAFVTTEDFPDGTWAYFLTEAFPVVPRCLIGEVPTELSPRRQPRR